MVFVAVCSVCHNEGLCVAPETCHCTGGWIGNTCNTGNCAICMITFSYVAMYLVRYTVLVSKAVFIFLSAVGWCLTASFHECSIRIVCYVNSSR